MREELTVRQRRAWMLCAGSVPAVAGCAGISWQWALLGGVFAALVLLLCERLHGKTGGMDLRGYFHAAFGRTAGGALCVLAAVWQLLALARLTHEGGLAFPESGDPTGTGLILLLLAAWCWCLYSVESTRCCWPLRLAASGARGCGPGELRVRRCCLWPFCCCRVLLGICTLRRRMESPAVRL